MSRWKILPDVDLYYTTTTIVEWQNVFTGPPYFDVILDTLKFCVANKGLHLHAYVIMPNHAHYILSAGEGKSFSDIMRDFNTHTSREITRLLEADSRIELLKVFADAAAQDGRGNKYKVWQDGYHPIALATPDFTAQKLNYLHDNPARKGYVDRPEQWRYSSARNYLLGDESLIKVELLF
jgi:REP element-mobilizing transposase RayT